MASANQIGAVAFVLLLLAGRGPAHMTVDSLSIDYSGETGGGGTPVDLCQTVPGDQGRECPDSAVSVYEIPITRDVANVTIRGSGSATVVGDNSEVSVEVSGVRDDVLASATTNGTLSFSETYRNLSPSGSTDELTLGIETTGMAGARLDGVTIWKDTDGDGFTDQRERIGFNTAFFGRISTDPVDPDTDGDDLEEGAEVGEVVSREQSYFHDGELHTMEYEFYRIHSHPLEVDTDDGLNDSIEVNGWNVTVVNRSGEMYRWHTRERLAPNEQLANVTFTSDPLLRDTDLDGLTDYEEKERYHTDPESRVSYNITEEHQREIIDVLHVIKEDRLSTCFDPDPCVDDLEYMMGSMGFITADSSTPDSVSDVSNLELTDRTDDFDFVVRSGYAQDDEDWERFGFEALDGKVRTDVWWPNDVERGPVDPWDPDTDDDGLTDGQESLGITRIADQPRIGRSPMGDPDDPYLTSPVDADTDGDGWWDGWIGVYGVGRSDNVVLYMENLRDGSGITGNEIVDEQTGIHTEAEAPIARGADINNDGVLEHSNLHLGELHWGTKTRDALDAPTEQTSLEVEVDYMPQHDPRSITGPSGRTVLEAAENNYLLYGLNIEMTVDGELTESELESVCTRGYPPLCSDYISAGSFNRHELDNVEDEFHDEPSDMFPTTLHMFWGARLGEDSPGTTVDHAYEFFGVDYSQATAMAFNNGAPGTEIWEEATNNDFGVFIGGEKVGSHADGQSVVMHELGHTLGIGYRDDDPIAYAPLVGGVVENGLEAYSGDVDGDNIGVDETPEQVGTQIRWSIMSSNSGRNFGGPNHNRFAFSIEEISTVDFEDIPSAGGS